MLNPLVGKRFIGKIICSNTFPGWGNTNSNTKIKSRRGKDFTFQGSEELEEIPNEADNAVTLLSWATEMHGPSGEAKALRITLKHEARLVRQKQYPSKCEARKGLEIHIDKFSEYELLKECKSEYSAVLG